MAGGPVIVGLPGGPGSIGNAIMTGGYTGGRGPGVATGSPGSSNFGAGAGGGAAGYGAAQAGSTSPTPGNIAAFQGGITPAGQIALNALGYTPFSAIVQGVPPSFFNASGQQMQAQQQAQQQAQAAGQAYAQQVAQSVAAENAYRQQVLASQAQEAQNAAIQQAQAQAVAQQQAAAAIASQQAQVAHSTVPPNPLSARNVLRELTGQVPGFNEVEQIGQYFENQLGFPEGFITRPPFTYPGVQGVSVSPPPGSPYFPAQPGPPPPPSYLAYQRSNQGPQEPPPIIPYQPSLNPQGLAPLVGQEYCPDCDPQNLALRSQRNQVQRDLQRERSQLRQKAISSQQQQIGKLEEREKLPVEYQRSQDIQDSIQQKMDMLQQIDRELQDLENQRASSRGVETQTTQTPPPRTPAPVEPAEPMPEQLPPIYESAPEGQPAYPPPAPSQQRRGDHLTFTTTPVIFCVGCESQNDAFRFLNGEPSKCSVIPEKGDAYA